MNAQRKTKAAPEQKRTDWLELLTGKFGKIAALLGVITAALVAIGPLMDALEKVIGRISAGTEGNTELQQSCVEIDPVNLPDEIAYEDWGRTHITVTGRNTCDRVLGLYVTFAHRVSDEPPRLVLRKPYDGVYPECSGGAAFSLPSCWDRQRPVQISEGFWRWEAPLPPLAQLGELRPVEVIGVTWDVRNMDAPDKTPLATSSVNLRITSKGE